MRIDGHIEEPVAKRHGNRHNRPDGDRSNDPLSHCHRPAINSVEQKDIYQLSRDLYDAEEATLKFAEFTGDGLHIDLDKYRP